MAGRNRPPLPSLVPDHNPSLKGSSRTMAHWWKLSHLILRVPVPGLARFNAQPRSITAAPTRLLLTLLVAPCAALLAIPSLAAQNQPVQDQAFSVLKVFPVGGTPRNAVLTPNGAELYVSNYADDTVSVIDTKSGTVLPAIPVGKNPQAMVASYDSSRVYVLVEDAVAIIDTSSHKVLQSVSVPRRTDEMALTRDGRLYLTRVYDGVSWIDTATGELHQALSTLCPIGIAISKDEKLMYVSYQCFGPGGTTAHDAVGVYALPSFTPLATIRGLANVGGQLLLSSDDSQVWIQGQDACSRPDYPHQGCPDLPSRIVNVLRASDFQSLNHFQDFDCAETSGASPGCPLLKAFPFSLQDFNGRMSMSPAGKAFIGGGINLKEVDIRDTATISLDKVTRLPIADTGDLAFTSDGQTAYVTLTDKNAVALLSFSPTAHDDPAARALVTSITPQTAAMTLDSNSYCAQNQSGLCYRVVPETMAAILHQRGFTGDKLKPDATDDPYCATAEQIIDSDPWRALAMMDMRSVEEYLRFDKSRVNADDPDAREFSDVTQRLINARAVQSYLDPSSVALLTVVCRHSYHTVLIPPKGDPVIWPPHNSPQPPVPQSALEALVTTFMADVSDSCKSQRILDSDAQKLYRVILGDPATPGSLAPLLAKARAAAPGGNLTLVWLLHDKLRYVPLAALYDGRHYLAQDYSSAVLLRQPDSAPSEKDALVVGLAESFPLLRQSLDATFSAPGSPSSPGKFPATFLLDAQFTPQSLSQALQSDYSVIHIASHFVLASTADASYLVTDSQNIPLPQFLPDATTRKSAYPFRTGLLTLEACSTAVSPPDPAAPSPPPARIAYGDGSEREDLGYVAAENGANAVLATLWDGQYISEDQMLRAFYANLRQGMSKSDALRTAQMSLRDGSPPIPPTACDPNQTTQSPYFWAPFVLMGSWK